MAWEKQPSQDHHLQQQLRLERSRVGGGGGLGFMVKVMTDEQIELLRRQISAYAAICEQLVEMHKAITAQQDFTGMRMGNLYCDPLIPSATHKITTRQRWTPTPVQLQILEHMFEQGNGTPSKQHIKEITAELSQHGHVVETNVYNWFQNRRARSKRKHLAAPSNGESETETDVESPKDKKTKPVNIHGHENLAPRAGNMHFPSQDTSTELQCLDTEPNKGEPTVLSDRGLRSWVNVGQSSFYDDAPSNARIDELIGKMEDPGSFCGHGLEGYDMVG